MNLKNSLGTTFIELVAVLLLISVVSAFTIIKYNDDSNLALEADILKNSFQHARIRALSDENHLWKIKFSGNGEDFVSYALYKNSSEDETVFEKDGADHYLAENVFINTTGGPFVEFDKWGSVKGLSGNYTITLKQTGGSKKVLKLNRIGFIDEDP